MSKLFVLLIGYSMFMFQGCSKDVQSKPSFKFKPAPDNSAGMKFGGEVISKQDLFSGIEADIYEQEKKLFDLKMNKVQAVILERLVKTDSRKKNLTNDQFLDKYITKGISVNKEQINAFIKSRNIPKEHQTAELTKRVEKFLLIDEKKKAVDSWVAKQTNGKDVEIYLIEPQRPVFPVVAGDAPMVGGKDAKVTIVEFSDFQCPFCSKGAKVVNELKKKYGNKIKIAFKNFPLPFHNQAKGAAAAGLCANAQGSDKFWKMHDLMFENQTKLSPEGLLELAGKTGVDMAKFKSCVGQNTYLAKVDQDIVDTFSELIDKELAK